MEASQHSVKKWCKQHMKGCLLCWFDLEAATLAEDELLLGCMLCWFSLITSGILLHDIEKNNLKDMTIIKVVRYYTCGKE